MASYGNGALRIGAESWWINRPSCPCECWPHPQQHLAGYAGILQADAYAEFNALYLPGRKPGPITEAACWAHGRRKLFKLAEVARAPLELNPIGLDHILLR